MILGATEYRLLVETVVLIAIVVAAAAAVRFYRHPKPPDSYRDLSQIVINLSGQVARTSVRMADMEALLSKYDRGVKILIGQLKKAGMIPDWEPNGELQKLRDGRAPGVVLYDGMMLSFNDEELEAIAFEMGTSFDDLGGDTRPGRIRELIEWAGRQNRNDELLDIVRRQRPTAAWPSRI